MKKLMCIVILLAVAILTACDKTPNKPTETSAPSNTLATTIQESTAQTPTTKPLPTYTPGSVSLLSPEKMEEDYGVTYEMKFRKCYYTIRATWK
ncbi:MAG: hypothetical protein LBT21_01470 [Oscillospiraceae bacterium]|nr:hypothetical protein [Oscillospiraceae bacterium]